MTERKNLKSSKKSTWKSTRSFKKKGKTHPGFRLAAVSTPVGIETSHEDSHRLVQDFLDRHRDTLQAAVPVTEKKLLKVTAVAGKVAGPVAKQPSLQSDEKDSVVVADPPSELKLMLKGLKGKGIRFSTRQCLVDNLGVQSTAGKYVLKFLSFGTPNLFLSNVLANFAEFSSLNVLFDEFFCHSVQLHYRPVNKYSANNSANFVTGTAAGQPGFVNTLGVSLCGLQHNQTVYSDTSAAVFNMAQCQQYKWANLSDNFTFTWKNVEKFSWDGTTGDQTTAHSTQAWCNMSNTSAYGGIIQASTAEPSGAAAALGTLVESSTFGHVMIVVNLSFRCRS